jgi:hypothetical protein
VSFFRIEYVALMRLAIHRSDASSYRRSVEDRHTAERSLSAALKGTTFGCESEGDHEWKG